MPAPKKPQDHKVSRAEAEAARAPFTFEVDGETYELPPFDMDRMPAGFFRKNRKDEAELMYGPIEAHADEATMDAFDHLPNGEQGRVIREWMQAAGESLPES